MTLDTTIDEGELGHILAHETLADRYNDGEEILSAVFASRPAAASVEAGTLFWATDTNVLYRSDGAVWAALDTGPTDHGALTGLVPDDDHTQYLKEKASGGLASETPTHTHLSAAEAGTVPGADTDAIHDNVANEIALTTYAAPLANDKFLFEKNSVGLAKRHAIGSDFVLTASAAGADTTAIHDNVAAEISAITEKVTPVAADLLVIEDSAAANAKKRVQIGNLPAAGGATFVHKTVDETINSSTVLQDDNHLLFTLEANGIYAFDFFLHYDSGTTPDFKFQWIEPDGTWNMMVQVITLASALVLLNLRETSTETTATGSTVPLPLTGRGVINAGAAGGTFKLQWAQNTSDAGNTTVKAGSWLSYKKLN